MGVVNGRGFIAIDGNKLREIFKKRGVTLRDVSRTCGFEDSYFSKATISNKMPLYAIKLLEDRYRIDSKEFVIEEKKEDVKEPATVVESKSVDFTVSEEVEKQLYKIIYSAVYEAVKKAWAE